MGAGHVVQGSGEGEVPVRRALARGIPLPFADRALRWMVFVIVVDVFLLGPFVAMLGVSWRWADLVMAVVLMLGALVTWGNLWVADMFVATSIGWIAMRLAGLAWPDESFEYACSALAGASYLILTYLLMRRVFAPGKVNMLRIQGAIAVYLLIGMVFAQAFVLISLSSPGAFLLLGEPASHERIAGSLTYYSFIALTTVGFGDITPVHPMARSFTVLAAVFGTLYPAILIARLVSQEILSSRS